MIQLIGNSSINIVDDNIDKKKLNDFNSFDEYDLNIIDLSDYSLWKNKDYVTTSIVDLNDLKSLSDEIFSSNQKILILLPQNINFKTYCNSTTPEYKRIKDIKDDIMKIINSNLYNVKYKISYGRSRTKIGNLEIDADFYFDNVIKDEEITTAIRGSKVTTIKRNKIWISTLNLIENGESLNAFINNVIFPIEKELIPEWLGKVNFYNDELLLKEKNKLLREKKELEDQIVNIDNSIDNNERIKSVLYTTGDELKLVVADILEEMLDYDLSGFKDCHEEDYLIKKDNITFALEVKGISTNIKRENVNQANNHVMVYLDKLDEDDIKENVKGLLIINHQRNTPLNERYPVSKDVINLAVINNILIIQTVDLLKLYEKFLSEDITSNQLIKILSTQKGLINTN